MNNKKLVLAITKANMGGAQKYVFDLARNLKTDFDITIITGNEGLLNQKLDNEQISNQVVNIKNSFNPFLIFPEITKLGKILKKEKPDIIHLNSGKMGLVGVLASKVFTPKSKLVFSNHGMVLNEPGKNSITKIILKLPYKIIFGLSDKIIAVSEAIKKDSISIYKKALNKIVVVKNGLENINFFGKKMARTKISAKISPNDFVIGTIAELHPVKGLEYLMRAMPKVILNKANAELVIIGGGKLEKELKKLAVDLNLEEKIIFAGFVSNASHLLKAFDIFVTPSISEALAYVVTEAGQSEVPVIATNVGGLPEIIKDKETGILVESKNSHQIAEKILWLADNSDKAQEFGTNASNFVKKEFDFEKFLRQTRKVYEQL